MANWPFLVGGRILWQLGGATGFGATLGGILDASRWKSTALCAILGAVLCFNPLLDVIQGPLDIEGKVVSAQTQRGKIWRDYGAYSPTIHGAIVIEVERNKTVKIEPRGRQANLWMGPFEQCRDAGGTIHATVLRHLDAILEARCSIAKNSSHTGAVTDLWPNTTWRWPA